MTITQITSSSKTDQHTSGAHPAPAASASPRARRAASAPPVPHGGPRPEHYERIWLNGTETVASLQAQGVPRTTARRAIQRGWYIKDYHRPQYPQAEGPGLFATLANPYAFATAQVRHVLRLRATGGLAPEDLEDAVQDALLWAWERRHCLHITDFPAYISSVIRTQLRRRYRPRS